ncbi:MAG: class I SAM-dependent methyltransferase [Candidatus Pacearchaeota archaeon]
MKFFKNYLNYKVSALLKEHNFKSPILEVGCGTGETLELLNKNYKIEGLDFSEHAIKKCKEKKLNARVGDFFENKKKYNSIICLDVIEHVKEDSKFIRHINKCLNKNGKLFALVPSGKMMNDDVGYGHYRRYSKEEIIKKIGGANFKIEHAEMFGYPFLHYLRIAMNYLISGKEVEKEEKEEKTKKSSYESLFDKSFFSKIADFFNNSKIVLKFLLLQDFFINRNKGLAVIVIARKI